MVKKQRKAAAEEEEPQEAKRPKKLRKKAAAEEDEAPVEVPSAKPAEEPKGKAPKKLKRKKAKAPVAEESDDEGVPVDMATGEADEDDDSDAPMEVSNKQEAQDAKSARPEAEEAAVPAVGKRMKLNDSSSEEGEEDTKLPEWLSKPKTEPEEQGKKKTRRGTNKLKNPRERRKAREAREAAAKAEEAGEEVDEDEARYEPAGCAPTKQKRPEEEASSKDKAVEAGDPNSLVVFVRNVSFQADAEQLRQEFAHCGEIVNVGMPVDEERGTHRGFAFLTFKDKEGVAAALNMDQHEFEGRPLMVKIGKSKTKRDQEVTLNKEFELFVKSKEIQGDPKLASRDLRRKFQGSGEVDSIKVATNKMGEARGMAWVRFKDRPSVRRAMLLNSEELIVEASCPLRHREEDEEEGGAAKEAGEKEGEDGEDEEDEEEEEEESEEEADDGGAQKKGKGKSKGKDGKGKDGKGKDGKGKDGKGKDGKGKDGKGKDGKGKGKDGKGKDGKGKDFKGKGKDGKGKDGKGKDKGSATGKRKTFADSDDD